MAIFYTLLEMRQVILWLKFLKAAYESDGHSIKGHHDMNFDFEKALFECVA